MKLYFSPGACSLSPHIVLRESGLAFTPIKVNLKTHQLDGGGDFYAVNPKGYVPVFELDDGTRLTEGPAIVQYIADQAPAAKLAPANGTIQRYQLQEWLNFITAEVHKQYSPLFDPSTSEEVKTKQREKLAKRYDWIAQQLGDKEYLTGLDIHRGGRIPLYGDELGKIDRNRYVSLAGIAKLYETRRCAAACAGGTESRRAGEVAMLPTVFVSHGSPMHAIDAGRAGDVWAQLGRTLPRPSAVLIASAHWETELPMLSTARQPETIHDFGGFPPELYKISYPARGAPDVSERAIQMLQSSGVAATANACRGLDHGAWVPLRRMFPNADVPVAQVSIQPSLDATHHLRVGTALAPLTRDGVLIIGSGHITHNLRDWMAGVRQRGSREVADGAADPYVVEFREWIAEALANNDRDRLVRWRELAPQCVTRASDARAFHAAVCGIRRGVCTHRARPRVKRLDAGVDSGVLAMDAYVFWPSGRSSEFVARCRHFNDAVFGHRDDAVALFTVNDSTPCKGPKGRQHRQSIPQPEARQANAGVGTPMKANCRMNVPR